jgi:hypothetical protein
MEPTAPAAPDTEAAIRAEIATLREQPFAIGESQLDRAAKTEALYKRLYPPAEPTAPRVAAAVPVSAEDAKASIPGLRAELDKHTPGSRRYVELEQQLEGAYKILHPEAAPAEATAAPLAVPPLPMELGGRFTYDDDALAELGPAVAAAGIPLDEIRSWMEAGHGYLLTGGATFTYDDAVTRLGESFPGHQRDALAALSRLSPRARGAVDRWLAATGFNNSGSFIEWLSGHGKRLKAGGRA